ncbi:hypothetical protein B8A46_05450 [Dolosigranulum pigrum]|uniref:helix-turn-helix domain-containing protein n=1 Tax=Dolosigranulum pigrum TaxID=29394 RepID=UPI000DC011BA|nr:helix-turn-helix transcriptional regulator [Dolosigranulum pigrum]RAN59828.1 hypothetical protein B8A46_05450 [Dolosigranulum pigrum]
MSLLIEHEAEHLAKWLSDKSNQEVANKIDVSNSLVYRYKRCLVGGSRKVVRRLMEAYDVDTLTLLGDRVPYIEHSLDDVGERIRQARIDAYLTVEDLAEELGVEVRTIIKWEWGESTPTRFAIEEIAYLTGLDDDEFFTMPLIEAKYLGPYLKKVREERGMSKTEMGYVADVNSMTILQWERGRSTSKIQSLKYIADLVGISLREMAEISKEQFIEEGC